MTSHLLAAAATVGLLGAGVAGAGDTRSFEAMTSKPAMYGGGANSSGMCRVDVVRTGAPGSADITRQDFNDGSCVCTIVTGPSGNNGSAEGTVESLLRDRDCAAAPGLTRAATASSGGGLGAGAIVGVLVGVGAAVAAASASGGSSNNDSAG